MNACGSGECIEVLRLPVEHKLEETSDSIIPEVWAGAMSIQRVLIPILLVDHDGVRLTIHSMRNIGDATGLRAGRLRERTQGLSHALPVLRAKFHANRETDHNVSDCEGF